MASPQIEAAAASQRTESDVRALRVIRPMHRLCPWCASEPPLAAGIAGKFIVGCENDDCFVQPQVSGGTMSEAWARWDSRI